MSQAKSACEQRAQFKLPHTLVIVFALLVMVLIASWIIPSGEFSRVEKDGRMLTVANTYHVVDKIYLGVENLLLSPIRGFVDGGTLIAFLLVVGGAFNILQETGAISVGIRQLTRLISARPYLEWLLIPALMSVFSLAGSVFGMAEETIPFVLIFVPLARSLGYDSIVGISIPFLGAAAGFAAAFFNPFTVGVAQKLADLPLNSGIGYRLVSWVVGTAVVTAYVAIYAARVKKNPRLSPVYELDQARDEPPFEPHQQQWDDGSAERRPVDERAGCASQTEQRTWTRRHVATLLVFGAALLLLVWGILRYHWDIDAIAALFLGMGLVLGAVSGMRPSKMAQVFTAGAKDMVNVVFIVSCARALLFIAKDAKILDTILYYSASLLSTVPRAMTAQVMFLIQALINFFIHSGTAQAALTMPIMAPLSDLVGITRQTMVYAFQLCEFVNPILPTSAVAMGVLGAAKVPWEIWARWFLPLLGILVLLSFALLIPPVLLFHWGPF